MSKENVHKKLHNHKLTLYFKVIFHLDSKLFSFILNLNKTKLFLECILDCRHMPSAVKQQTLWYEYVKSHIKPIKRIFCFIGGGGGLKVFLKKNSVFASFYKEMSYFNPKHILYISLCLTNFLNI